MAQYSRKTRKVKRGGGFVVVAVVLTAIAVAVGMGMFFRVSTVSVDGRSLYGNEKILEAADIETGTNMLLLDERRISSKVTSALPYIESVSVKKEYPSTVIIGVEEDAPIATFISDGKTWMLNTKCRLFEAEKKSDAKNLIKIIGAGIESPKTGDIANVSGGDTQLKCIQELLSAIRENELENKIGAVSVSNIGRLSFDFDDRFIVNLGAEGEIGDKVRMLIGAVDKLGGAAKGNLEFTTAVELHFVPDGE